MSAMKSMVVAGVMSGTSADGIDVALCRIRSGDAGAPITEVLGNEAFAYPAPVREAVLRAMAAEAISVAELSRLNWRLGTMYADAVERTTKALGVTVELVGCHGQTIYHQARPELYLGAEVRCTWQTGEAAVIAERMRCPVVSDFRPADLAAGGQAAPLVPMLDWVMFRSETVGRVLANLGGIANVTAIPAGAAVEEVMAFDTGPGNMVIDHCMERLFGEVFDRNGEVAARGLVLVEEVARAGSAGYFASAPPKSCGREEFGRGFAERFIGDCQRAGAKDADIVATATALTSSAMVEAYERFVAKRLEGAKEVEFVVAGGGVKNRTLMRMLTEAFDERGVRVRRMEELGVAAETKEAVAFALLAWMTWARLPGNVVGATGAKRPVVLGKVSFG